LLEEASQNVCKNHQICTKNVLKKAFKSTPNASSMYKKMKYPALRTIFPKFSQVKSKDHYENISGIEMRPYENKPVKMSAKETNYVKKCTKKDLKSTQNSISMSKKTKYPTSKDNNP